VAAPLGLLGLIAWGLSARWVAGAAACFLAGLGLIAWGPDGSERAVSGVVFGTSGAITLVSLTAMAVTQPCLGGAGRRQRDGRFLAQWWLLEVAGYGVLSPWPAVRRILGIVVVGTLMVGSRAGLTARTSGCRWLIRGVAAFAVALGLLFQAIDIDNAAAERDAVTLVTAWVRERDPSGPIWFVGHLGMQFYGERAGWRPVVPDESWLSAGSWLVVPERNFGQQRIIVPPEAVPAAEFAILSRWPLCTIPWYHGTNKALDKQRGPILTLAVYRITADCIPRTPEDGGQLLP
jgi:hypothetical protein